ncbi:DUF2157 domain-containing protein [Adhaeribacter soli]|uniref:DUF2157 domain-containing protein n=1 Tax=Adhaeribacter soli TaxID=2607655 RepID=A0A5N1IZH7_9BACT|nr:DUF2157 domain-containing protein [Adhaeribacter soli]KAA9338866.1 DUF2157 domain-containing protein [Adhaeribacter soli]
MASDILKDLPELVNGNLISAETAEKIRLHYRNKSKDSSHRPVLVFGILGALITGLGIILIIAHNWDELSRQTKTILAFIPLLLGQVAAGYTLLKKDGEQNRKEAAATFLFLAVGATISLISQIYHIPGKISSFLLTWMLLCLPLVYLMRSGTASLLFLLGITYYAAETGYWTYGSSENYYYWPLLLAVLPFYFFLFRKKPQSNFLIFHNWFLPLSVTIALGTVARHTEEFMFIAYLSLFGLFLQLGSLSFFNSQKLRNNGFKICGFAGTVALLLFLSFETFWKSLGRQPFKAQDLISPEFISAVLVTITAGLFLFRQYRQKPLTELNPFEIVFLVFALQFPIGYLYPLAGAVAINLLTLFLGIFTIRSGARQDSLGILNFGLLLITALVICRFFDTNLTFIARGVLFILVGLSFFAANYYLLKKRKTA